MLVAPLGRRPAPAGWLLPLAPALVGFVRVPRLAVLAMVQPHRHLVDLAPLLPLGLARGRRCNLRYWVLCQHRGQPLQQAAFVGVAQGELDLPARDGDMAVHRGRRLGQGRRRGRSLHTGRVRGNFLHALG